MKARLFVSTVFFLGTLSQHLEAQDNPLFQHLQPEAYWNFNRCDFDGNLFGDGLGVVLDSSRCGIHAVLSGGRCSQGRTGAGVTFDGVNDHAQTVGFYANFRDADCPTALDFTDKLTVAAWVYPERLSGLQTIVNKWYHMDSFGLFTVGGSFAFSVAFPDGGLGTVVNVYAPATVGKWSHLVGVFDGEKVILYVDGDEVDRETELPGDVLQQSTNPIVIGNHPEWNAFKGRIDEVALFNAALTEEEVRSLAGVGKGTYFGADTSAHPEDGEFFDSVEYGYDLYAGRLSVGLDTCRVHRDGWDIFNWEDVEGGCLAFQYDAATVARPDRTYAYSWLVGPSHDDAGAFQDNLTLFGAYQAAILLGNWWTYEHLVGGRTLFADVERCLRCPPGQDTSGWEVCPPYEDTEPVPEPCRRNQMVLAGFLQTVAVVGYWQTLQGRTPVMPGVYTNAERWVEFFGKPFLPRTDWGAQIPFVLWLTSCNTTVGVGGERSIEEVKVLLPTVEQTVLGGMHTVIWQHHINKPDWDAARQNPAGLFLPSPASSPYNCTCSLIGGSCPP
ncbi:MAG: LamG domain-containing protein [Candidatus Hydrogenedentota bacterium]|nr:MAG: LamG domain-containing protein [Candidatus Hydrogenedentota bacterium]